MTDGRRTKSPGGAELSAGRGRTAVIGLSALLDMLPAAPDQTSRSASRDASRAMRRATPPLPRRCDGMSAPGGSVTVRAARLIELSGLALTLRERATLGELVGAVCRSGVVVNVVVAEALVRAVERGGRESAS